MRRGQGGLLVKFNWKRSDQSVSNSFLTRRIRSHLLTSPIEMASSVAQLEKLWCEAAPGRLAPISAAPTPPRPLFQVALGHPTCNASRTYNATGPAKGSDLAKVTDPDRAEVTNHTPPHPTCI